MFNHTFFNEGIQSYNLPPHASLPNHALMIFINNDEHMLLFSLHLYYIHQNRILYTFVFIMHDVINRNNVVRNNRVSSIQELRCEQFNSNFITLL